MEATRRSGRVVVDIAWPANWLWFGGREYPLDLWRRWRDMLWDEMTGRVRTNGVLTGCDAPHFGTLAHLPLLRDQLAADWGSFRRWWDVGSPQLAAAFRAPGVGSVLTEAGEMMPDGHKLTLLVVGLPDAQALAESHRFDAGAHHAAISVGMATDPERLAEWLHPLTEEIAAE